MTGALMASPATSQHGYSQLENSKSSRSRNFHDNRRDRGYDSYRPPVSDLRRFGERRQPLDAGGGGGGGGGDDGKATGSVGNTTPPLDAPHCPYALEGRRRDERDRYHHGGEQQRLPPAKDRDHERYLPSPTTTTTPGPTTPAPGHTHFSSSNPITDSSSSNNCASKDPRQYYRNKTWVASPQSPMNSEQQQQQQQLSTTQKSTNGVESAKGQHEATAGEEIRGQDPHPTGAQNDLSPQQPVRDNDRTVDRERKEPLAVGAVQEDDNGSCSMDLDSPNLQAPAKAFPSRRPYPLQIDSTNFNQNHDNSSPLSAVPASSNAQCAAQNATVKSPAPIALMVSNSSRKLPSHPPPADSDGVAPAVSPPGLRPGTRAPSPSDTKPGTVPSSVALPRRSSTLNRSTEPKVHLAGPSTPGAELVRGNSADDDFLSMCQTIAARLKSASRVEELERALVRRRTEMGAFPLLEEIKFREKEIERVKSTLKSSESLGGKQMHAFYSAIISSLQAEKSRSVESEMVQDLKARVESLEKTNAELRSQLPDIRNDWLPAYRDMGSRLEYEARHISENYSSIKYLTSLSTKHKERFLAHESDIGSLFSRMNKAEDNISAQRQKPEGVPASEIDALRTKVESITQELRDNLLNNRSEVKELAAAMGTFKSELLGQISNHKKGTDDTVSGLQGVMTTLREDCERLGRRAEEAASTMQELTTSLSKLRKEAEQPRATSWDESNIPSSFLQRISNMEKAISEQNEESALLRQKIGGVEIAQETRSNSILTMQDRLADLAPRVQKVEQSQERDAADQEERSAKVANLSKTINELKSKIASLMVRKPTPLVTNHMANSSRASDARQSPVTSAAVSSLAQGSPVVSSVPASAPAPKPATDAWRTKSLDLTLAERVRLVESFVRTHEERFNSWTTKALFDGLLNSMKNLYPYPDTVARDLARVKSELTNIMSKIDSQIPSAEDQRLQIQINDLVAKVGNTAHQPHFMATLPSQPHLPANTNMPFHPQYAAFNPHLGLPQPSPQPLPPQNYHRPPAANNNSPIDSSATVSALSNLEARYKADFNQFGSSMLKTRKEVDAHFAAVESRLTESEASNQRLSTRVSNLDTRHGQTSHEVFTRLEEIQKSLHEQEKVAREEKLRLDELRDRCATDIAAFGPALDDALLDLTESWKRKERKNQHQQQQQQQRFVPSRAGSEMGDNGGTRWEIRHGSGAAVAKPVDMAASRAHSVASSLRHGENLNDEKDSGNRSRQGSEISVVNDHEDQDQDQDKDQSESIRLASTKTKDKGKEGFIGLFAHKTKKRAHHYFSDDDQEERERIKSPRVRDDSTGDERQVKMMKKNPVAN